MPHKTSRLESLVARIRENPGLPGELVNPERDIVDDALEGDNVHTIAARHSIAEEAVWHVLDDAARLATGNEPSRRIVTGGMRSDTITGKPDTAELGIGDWGGEPGPGDARKIGHEQGENR